MEEKKEQSFSMEISAPLFLKSLKILLRMGKGPTALCIKEGKCTLLVRAGSVEMYANVTGECYVPFDSHRLKGLLASYKKEEDIIHINEQGLISGPLFVPLKSL